MTRSPKPSGVLPLNQIFLDEAENLLPLFLIADARASVTGKPRSASSTAGAMSSDKGLVP